MPKVKPVPGALKAPKYTLPRHAAADLHRLRPQLMDDGELLDRVVQGQPASDLEERFARALDKNERVSDYEFQPSYIAGHNLPGEIRPDFGVYAPNLNPVQVDGEIGHSTAEQLASDAVKDALLDEHLAGSGAARVVRVKWVDLQTQEDADRLVREMF